MPALLTRLGLVVHPTRNLEPALGTLREWAAAHGAEVTQIETVPGERRVAPLGEASDADVIVAVGGDGTVLAALRVAAGAGRPVLGVACGSLGALAAVAPDRITEAMDRIAGGDCDTVALPALEVTPSTGDVLRALNDLVIVRAGAGQVRVEAWLDGALYARWAGDGLILATALGSSAYTLAAGGPLLAPPATGTVLTALASHGGCIPSLVAPEGARWRIDVAPGYSGARVELDGHATSLGATTFEATLVDSGARVLRLGHEERFVTALRRRGIIADSPRMIAEDRRRVSSSRT